MTLEYAIKCLETGSKFPGFYASEQEIDEACAIACAAIREKMEREQLEKEDVTPVVHGIPCRKNRPKMHKRYEEFKTENGEVLYKTATYVDESNWVEYCPKCGKRLCSRFNNYCPNCGAKMGSEQ